MNRIDAIFAELRATNRRALAPFICAGRPGLDRLTELLQAIERAGASLVEIGIPFSDPIADGPVIAAAMHRALQAGVTPDHVFEAVAEARASTNLGLVAMVSVSIVSRLGLEHFTRRAHASGFDGLILPDVPLDESEPLRAAADAAGLTLSLLVAPTTTPERTERIVRASSGFLYMLARTGITGERAENPNIAPQVARLRAISQLPIACGFGISTPAQVRSVVEHVDVAIVGSALVRRLEDAIERGEDAVAVAEEFVRSLSQGLA